MEVINRYITIKNHVDGASQDSDFELRSSPLVLSLEPGSDEVIVKNLYVSIYPGQLIRMKSYSSSQECSKSAAAITPGEDIDAYGVGKVVVSGNPKFGKGDIVAGLLKWGEFTVVKPGGMLNKLDPMGFPLSYHVGMLGSVSGLSGLTAYAGFFEVCKPKKGEKVFVSAALGSVGNLVGQFAKVLGCYVVGCAGSKEKVALLKEKLGFDDAFNYREEPDLESTLQRYFPDGIDIYFDNVGGHMQKAAVSNMNINGRIAVCGVISEYTDRQKRAAPSMMDVIYKRIKIQGFLAGDYLNLFGDFLSTTCDYLRTGEIQPLEDISDGVESIPSALINLFGGQNTGKKIIKVAEE
ncbi:hypothetical protein V6N13_144711 [Hibiscus sabdariffa]